MEPVLIKTLPELFHVVFTDVELSTHRSFADRLSYVEIKVYRKILTEAVRPWREVLATDTE